MSVAIGRSPSDIPEIYVNGVMGGAHCSTFVSAEENGGEPTDSYRGPRNIIYAGDIDKLLFRNGAVRHTVRGRRGGGDGGGRHAARPSIGPVRRLFLLH